VHICNPDEVEKIWNILEMFEATPEIDERTKRKISERIDYVFQSFSDKVFDHTIHLYEED
jgi:hypothetical protein